MATEQGIATVSTIVGSATVRDADGNVRVLNVGDEIRQGEVVITSGGSVVTLVFVDGTSLALADEAETLITDDIARTTQAAPEASAVDGATVEEIIVALEPGESLDDLLEDPAAGAGAGGVDDEGSGFVMLARIDSPTDPVNYEFRAFDSGTPELEFTGDPLEPEDEPLSEPEPLTPTSPPPETPATGDAAETVTEAALANGSGDAQPGDNLDFSDLVDDLVDLDAFDDGMDTTILAQNINETTQTGTVKYEAYLLVDDYVLPAETGSEP